MDVVGSIPTRPTFADIFLEDSKKKRACISRKSRNMKFGIVVAKDIAKAQELEKKIKKYLEDRGHQIAAEKLESADVVLTLGGDGTLIHAACESVKASVPFFGINAGTLGFLTAAEGSEWKEAIDKNIRGDYVISERMTLAAGINKNAHLRGVRALRYNSGQAHLEGGNYRALNEVVIKGMYRVVDLEILVNNQQFLRITGDGVIVATPTGSTAYSLSAGGPIVDPEIDCLLVTPINAVGLPIPSVALSPEDKLEVKILSGDDISLIVDGQEHTKVSQSQSVKVGRGKYRVKFGYFDKRHFLKALNSKFGFSLRPRFAKASRGEQVQGKPEGLLNE